VAIRAREEYQGRTFFLPIKPHGARMKFRGRSLRRGLERKIARLGMNRGEVDLLLEEDPRDVVRELLVHGSIDHEHVGNSHDGDGRPQASVRAWRNLERKVQFAVLLPEHRYEVRAWQQTNRNARGMRQILQGGRRESAAPEEGVDLAVLERVRRLRCPEALTPHVAIGVESGGAQHAKRDHFGAAARRPGGRDFPFQVGDARNPGRCERDEVRVVGIQDGDARGRDRRAGKRAATRYSVGQRVREREGDIRLSVANELEVID
jgi:hypothetical protein